MLPAQTLAIQTLNPLHYLACKKKKSKKKEGFQQTSFNSTQCLNSPVSEYTAQRSQKLALHPLCIPHLPNMPEPPLLLFCEKPDGRLMGFMPFVWKPLCLRVIWHILCPQPQLFAVIEYEPILEWDVEQHLLVEVVYFASYPCVPGWCIQHNHVLMDIQLQVFPTCQQFPTPSASIPMLFKSRALTEHHTIFFVHRVQLKVIQLATQNLLIFCPEPVELIPNKKLVKYCKLIKAICTHFMAKQLLKD